METTDAEEIIDVMDLVDDLLLSIKECIREIKDNEEE